MADGLSIQVDSREVDRMLGKLLNKVECPRPLMAQIEKLVHARTMQMFRGPRPDRVAKRGVKWPPLAESTIWAKRAAAKRGAIGKSGINRPLVGTGGMRDSLKTLRRAEKGFEYGTKRKSPEGFPYPAIHNVGDSKIPQRQWLFLTREDLAQMVSMAVDYLNGKMVRFRGK